MKILPASSEMKGLSGGATPGPAEASGAAPAPFRRLLAEVNHLQSQADQKIRQAVAGQVDLHEAMLALEEASLGLKVVLQVRNKVVQAYEELSRMPL